MYRSCLANLNLACPNSIFLAGPVFMVPRSSLQSPTLARQVNMITGAILADNRPMVSVSTSPLFYLHVPNEIHLSRKPLNQLRLHQNSPSDCFLVSGPVIFCSQKHNLDCEHFVLVFHLGLNCLRCAFFVQWTKHFLIWVLTFPVFQLLTVRKAARFIKRLVIYTFL